MGNVQSQLDRSSDEAGQRAEAEINRFAAIERDKQLAIYGNGSIAKERQLRKQPSGPTHGLEEGRVASEQETNSLDVESSQIMDSSQPMPNAGDFLASFEPRKEKEYLKKASVKVTRTKSSDNKYLGFGNVPEKDEKDKLATKLSKLDTRSHNVNDSEKIASAPGSAKDPTSATRSSAGPPHPPTKRPAQEPVLANDRRLSLPSLGKIPKRTSVASPQSPDRVEGQELTLVGDERPPKWYKDTPVPTSRGRNDSNVDILLASLRERIKKCKHPRFAKDPSVQEAAFMDIRDKLHKIIFCEVKAPLLKLYRMLHNEDGLPQIFDARYSGGVSWPFDIQADAKELYNKWSRRIFETDILRGIRFQVSASASGKDGGRNEDSIDPKYKGVVPSKFHGNGDLLNGQWWPLQLCALRDGAHGASQQGISGSSEEGAYSCIMSGGHDYPDVDEGEDVWYCGTDSVDGSITPQTRYMLQSENNNPVRLIRSHNLKSEHAPLIGFRYDGLYDVVESRRLDPANSLRQRHIFHLVRQDGQDPIRGGNGPKRRPTEQEMEEYHKHKRRIGKVKGQD